MGATEDDASRRSGAPLGTQCVFRQALLGTSRHSSGFCLPFAHGGPPTISTMTRRLARLGGAILIGSGILALAWAFAIWQWGDPVTALFTRWEQRQLQAELRTIERRYRPLPSTAPTKDAPSPTPKRSAAEVARLARSLRSTTDRGGPLGRIRVDRLDLNMIMVDGTDHASLKRGPGVDGRTSLPGQGKLVYIAGHRTTYGAPFAHIDRLETGDRIELEMPYGTFVYRVSSHVIVDADDIDRLRTRGREEVALQACHPRFSAKRRYIVYATPIVRT
jgi:sortase A